MKSAENIENAEKIETPLPRCSECGGKVVLDRGVGRTREYRRGEHLPIPDTFLVPTCQRCGEIFMIPEISTKLDALLRRQYLAKQAAHARYLLDTLCLRHSITQRDVERACRVTPSYLSHVVGGRREASLTLRTLLESFLISPQAFEYALSGQPWDVSFAPLFELKSGRTYAHRDPAFRCPGGRWAPNAWPSQDDDTGIGQSVA